MNSLKTKLYRDVYHRKLAGVCAGIADYTGIDRLWVRLGTVLLAFFSGPLTISAYILLGLFLPKKPPHLYIDPEQAQYWQRVRQNPARSGREIRSHMRDIDRRLAEVERFYVDGNTRLAAEIEQLR